MCGNSMEDFNPMTRTTQHDYKTIIGADPVENPRTFAKIIAGLKEKHTYREIEDMTGIPKNTLCQRMRRLKHPTERHSPAGIRHRRNVLPDGTYEDMTKRPDYLHDVLPIAIKGAAERLGVTVGEFLRMNERGMV